MRCRWCTLAGVHPVCTKFNVNYTSVCNMRDLPVRIYIQRYRPLDPIVPMRNVLLPPPFPPPAQPLHRMHYLPKRIALISIEIARRFWRIYPIAPRSAGWQVGSGSCEMLTADRFVNINVCVAHPASRFSICLFAHSLLGNVRPASTVCLSLSQTLALEAVRQDNEPFCSRNATDGGTDYAFKYRKVAMFRRHR